MLKGGRQGSKFLFAAVGAAVVTLAEDGCWGQVSFVDYFNLARFGDTWKITNKTFAHTAGEMPPME